MSVLCVLHLPGKRERRMLSYLLSLLETEEDKGLFEEIYLQTHVELELYIRSYMKNQQDTEDALQNTYVNAIDAFHKLRPIPNDQRIHWLRRVGYNVMMDHFRQQKEDRKRKEQAAAERWATLSEEASYVSTRREVAQLILKLPETYRAALELKILEDCSGEEIAQRLGITLSNANTRVSRGRTLLREIMDREGFSW